MQKAMNFNDIAIVSVKRNDFWYMMMMQLT